MIVGDDNDDDDDDDADDDDMMILLTGLHPGTVRLPGSRRACTEKGSAR